MDSVQPSQSINKLCRICCVYYGNHNTKYLCSKCYEAVISYHTFTQSLLFIKNSQVFQQPFKQIKKGLLLYPCREPANSRLRLTHSSTFKVILTRELRKDLLKPAFRKTLKYARRFKDNRRTLLDQEIKNLRYYYLSSQVIRQLKGIMYLYILVSESLTGNMFVRLCLSISRLKVSNLVLSFTLTSPRYGNSICYLESIILMIRKMRNLHYLSFKNSQSITFGPNSKKRLPKYWRMISRLTNLTEVSLGYCHTFDFSKISRIFLNHSHLRKIQATIPGHERKYSEAFFKDLVNIKELDYLQIDVDWMKGLENCTIQYHVGLVNFLHSVNSIGTLAIKEKEARYLPLNDYAIYPSKLTNVKQIITMGYQFNSCLRLIQLTNEAVSLQMTLKNHDESRAAAISAAISKNINLKHLAIKFDICYPSFAASLLKQITLTEIISISLDFTGYPSDSPAINQSTFVLNPFLNFATKQNELKEIRLQLFCPVQLEKVQDLLQKLKELPKLELLTIHLKICNEFSSTDKDYTDDIQKFYEKLSKLEDLEFSIDLKGNLIIQKMAPLPLLQN